ncbi:MAG: GTPase RsgA [Bacteroides sp. SM23_62_1]|nr:MAG: GTPase RsgA [Bacteroides sp. SM23_62_1]
MSEEGRVIKSTGNFYTVVTSEMEKVDCILTGRYRLEDLKSTNPVVVGDLVVFDRIAREKQGRIIDVLERKNYIIRKSSKLSKTYQVIAANIDQLFLMATIAYPKTFPEFIDRYLVTAEAYSIPSILLFNKTDLYDHTQFGYLKELMNTYTKIGYPCYAVSSLNKNHLIKLEKLFIDKITLIAGNSGVGKSTFINTLFPDLNLKTQEISNHHQKGKHTTTFVEMFPLPCSGYIIDTPGIKGFGIIDMENEPLFHYFPELFRISKYCKYYNCIHVNEPDCAVIDALEKGEISLSRYKSYLSLLEEQKDINNKYRK